MRRRYEPSTGRKELEEQIGGHYGEAISLADDSEPFTLSSVIKALNHVKENDPQLRLTPAVPVLDPPATYEEAYKRLAEMWAKGA